ncbi:MAG: response regulator [Lachnospiraceae bacterium]|nr:response regulator [Lachnospiraceae bacterium]
MIEINRFNLLLVDDEEMPRRSVKRMIDEAACGFEVVAEAKNGREAVEIIKTENIHAVITDIRMPEMDGLELSETIHTLFPDMPVLLLSGYAEFEYAQKAILSGVTSYLLKPIDPSELADALDTVKKQLSQRYVLPDDPTLGKRDAKENVDYAVNYLNQHYNEDIDIRQLAEELGFTSAYLTKLFHKYIGDPPLKYLTNIRIQHAKDLLINSNLSICEIGNAVGYPDQFHFSKTFRKLTGESPSSYRKEAHHE